MAKDEWEARWDDDGGCQHGLPAEAPASEQEGGTPAGVIVVMALVPFFLFPILGMALGRLAGTFGMIVGGILGFSMAIGIAYLLGKRLERASHHERKRGY